MIVPLIRSLSRFVVPLYWIPACLLAQTSLYQSGVERAISAWESAIAAKGGRDRLNSIRNLAVSYRDPRWLKSGQKRQWRIEYLFVFPDRFWCWADERAVHPQMTPRIDIVMVDRGLRWISQVGSPDDYTANVTSYRPTRLAEIQLVSLMETRWLRPEPLSVDHTRIGRRKVDVIRARAENQLWDFYLDDQTRLPVRLRTFVRRTPGRPEIEALVPPSTRTEVIEVSWDLEDYRLLDGIKLPHTIRRTEGNVRWSTHRVEYDINPTYDPAIFKVPPTQKTGPGDWRPKP